MDNPKVEIQPKSEIIRSKANKAVTEVFLFLTGASMGGVTQILTEQPTAIVNGVEIEKFPEGMNFSEEFIEGALPVLVGMMAGKMFYKYAVNKLGYPEGRKLEKYLMVCGGMFGYTSMMVLGHVIHQLTGQPDVKIGVFK